MHYREELRKAEMMNADQVIIEKKVQEHQEEYQRLRNERLAKGYRAGSIYKRLRQKEVIEKHSGPELAIVLKGELFERRWAYGHSTNVWNEWQRVTC